MLFAVSFDGNVGELKPGDPVNLRGFTVGEVEQIGFHYEPETGSIATPVTLALYPALLPIRGTPPVQPAGGFQNVVNDLVSHGLRAQLERDPPLIGGYHVTLEIVPSAAPASLNTAASLPEIPTAPIGNGLESIVSRFNKVPIEQIAQNVLDITHHVDDIVASPQLKESVAQLDASLREIRQTIRQIAPQVTHVVERLRATAEQLEHTATAADNTLGGATTQTGVQNTLREIKEAAGAVRALADYLDRHPEALISGRRKQ